MSHPAWPHVRAAGVAGAAAFLLLMGAPGFDYLAGNRKRAEGPVWSTMLDLHERYRRPLVDPFYPWENRTGLRQQWHFYGTGASRCRRFEIRVDGEVWHRSNSRKHDFLAGAFANPRLRHLMKNWVRGKSGWVTRPMFAYITAEVLAVHPDAQTIEIRGREGAFPGKRLKTIRTLTGHAPTWAPR